MLYANFYPLRGVTYDNQYRISSLITGSIFNLAYGYDPNGNVISIEDAVSPTGVETLENPETYSYQPQTNKLSHIETTPPIDFGYDENANITSETGWFYVYDKSNQLITVSQALLRSQNIPTTERARE